MVLGPSTCFAVAAHFPVLCWLQHALLQHPRGALTSAAPLPSRQTPAAASPSGTLYPPPPSPPPPPANALTASGFGSRRSSACYSPLGVPASYQGTHSRALLVLALLPQQEHLSQGAFLWPSNFLQLCGRGGKGALGLPDPNSFPGTIGCSDFIFYIVTRWAYRDLSFFSPHFFP